MMPFSPPTFPQNGAESPFFAPSPPPPPPAETYTNEEIIRMVDQHETDVLALRDRMEGDFNLYRLDSYVPRDVVSGEPLSDYASYTSPEPHNFANKVISWLTQAELLLRVEHTNDRLHPPETDNLKERFAVGLLRAADERLVRILQPMLRGQLAFYASVRGGVLGGRALLRKDEAGKTYGDVTPWDPQNTHYGVGADGLLWACYKIKKTRQQIQDEYGVVLENADERQIGSTNAEQEGIDVYDFYDTRINTIITAAETLKPPTPHGSTRVPTYMVLVGNVPMIQPMTTSGVIANIGESVYESVRGVYSQYNNIMSIVLELVARSRRPPIGVTSASGTKTLPEDPFVEGSTIALKPDEKVEALKLLEMAKDTSFFVGSVLGEIQRSTLPHSVYGELAFQLSGYAINTLRQGIETVLSSRLEAMEQIYLQIANLFYDQYQTGYFNSIQLSGMEKGRKYFSQTITPDMVAGACDYTVKLVSRLPQDDMSKYTIAGLAREFFSRLWIKDNILGIQDSEQTEEQFMKQKSQEVLPEAALYTLMKAAEDQGEDVLAGFYYGELLKLLMAKQGMVPPGMGPGGGGGQGAPPGARPEVMPFAATGAPPSPQTSNNGPAFVASGTPRPGAGPQL